MSQWIEFLSLSGTDELTYDAPRTRIVQVPVHAGLGFIAAGSTYDSVYYGGPEGVTIFNSGAGAKWTVPLHVPAGAVIKGWRAIVDPDAIGGGTAPTTVQLQRIVSDYAVPGSSGVVGVGTGKTSSGASPQVLTSDVLSETVTGDSVYTLTVNHGVPGGYARLHALEVTYTETRATGHF